MSNRIGGGWRGTGYLGTKASQPPEVWIVDRDPTQYDTAQYSLMDVWLNEVTDTPWMLVSLKGTTESKGMLARWIRFGEGDLQTLTGDDDIAIEPVNFNINILTANGSGLVTSNTAPGTMTISTTGGGSVGQFIAGNAGGAVPFDATGTIFLLGQIGSGIVVDGNPGTSVLTIAPSGGGSFGQTITGQDAVAVPFSFGAGNLNLTGTAASGLFVSGNAGTNTTFIGLTGGGAIPQSITGDTGGAVFPSALGNWNLNGFHGINVNGVPGTNTLLPAINNTIILGDLVVVTATHPSLTLTSGDLTISGTGANAAGNINMPATTADERQGEYRVAGVRWMSSYGTNNAFVGAGSGSINNFGANSGENTAFGAAALTNLNIGGNGAQGNTAIGYNALNNYSFSNVVNTTGGNTALGALAGQAITTGSENTALGWSTLLTTTTAAYNVGVGSLALAGVTTGAANIGIGVSAGITAGVNALSTGDFNIIIGFGAGNALAGAESSNIYIGSSGVAAEGNTIRIGTSGAGNQQQNACYIAGIRGIATGVADAVAVLIDSNGQLGTVNSSIRFKENVNDMGSYSDDIMRLRPVTFQYKNRSSERVHVGLIAEEVGDSMPDLVVFDKEGFTETVRYNDLVPMLLNELQKAVTRIDRLESHISDLERIMIEKRSRK